jgi:heat shock protein HtpX
MAAALQKIEALSHQTLAAAQREEGMSEDALATMKIHGQSRGMAHLFATHPPTEARIAALRALPRQ